MPMFTRRHYIALANVIREGRDEALVRNDLFGVADLDRVADKLATVFLRDNPRFDAPLFHSACVNSDWEGK